MLGLGSDVAVMDLRKRGIGDSLARVAFVQWILVYRNGRRANLLYIEKICDRRCNWTEERHDYRRVKTSDRSDCIDSASAWRLGGVWGRK